MAVFHVAGRGPLHKLVTDFATAAEDVDGDMAAEGRVAGGFKFGANALVTGKPVDAALGVNRYLHVDDKLIWTGMGEGEKAIEREFKTLGKPDDLECLACACCAAHTQLPLHAAPALEVASVRSLLTITCV